MPTEQLQCALALSLGTLLDGWNHSSKGCSLIWCFDDGREHRLTGVCLRTGDCEDHSIWFTSFSYSSNQSVTPCTLWMGALSSWKDPSHQDRNVSSQHKGHSEQLLIHLWPSPTRGQVDPNNASKKNAGSLAVGVQHSFIHSIGWLIWPCNFLPHLSRPVPMVFTPLNS